MRGATLFSVVSSLDIIAPTLFCENKLSTNHNPPNTEFFFNFKVRSRKFFFSTYFFSFQERYLPAFMPNIPCPPLLSSYSREEAHYKLARSHTDHAPYFIHDSHFR
jgi:hypothetical protein